jgi:hypothetical protein
VVQGIIRQNLRLSTEPGSAARTFHFTCIVVVPLGDPGTSSKGQHSFNVAVACDGGRVAVLVRMSDGLPFAYMTNGFFAMVDPRDPGQILLCEAGQPRFVFAPEKQLIKLWFGQAPTTAPSVELDPPGLLRDGWARARTGTVDEPNGLVRFDSEKAVVTVRTAPKPTDAPLGFVEMAIQLQNGYAMAVGDIAADAKTAVKMLGIDASAVKGLGVPLRTIARLEGDAPMALVPPAGFGSDPVQRATAQKLAALFPPDPAVARERRGAELVRRIDDLQKVPSTRPTDDLPRVQSICQPIYDEVLRPLCGGIDMQALQAVLTTANPDENLAAARKMAREARPFHWWYDRAKALADLDDAVGSAAAERLQSALLDIAADPNRHPRARFFALDFVGDCGVSADQRTRLETLGLDNDPLLNLLLATVRARLGQKMGEAELGRFAKAVLDEESPLPLRLRCLEALCAEDSLPDAPAVILRLVNDEQQPDLSVKGSDPNRYLYALASSARGRQMLMGVLRKQHRQLPIHRAIAGLASQLRDNQPEWKAYLDAVTDLALDPLADANSVAMAAAIVSFSADDAKAAEVARFRLGSIDPNIRAMAANILISRRMGLAFLPELQVLSKSRDAQSRQLAMQVLAAGFKRGVDGAAGLGLIGVALADPSPAVRMAGLNALASAQRFGTSTARLQQPVVKIIRAPATPEELRAALWDLVLLSDGNFSIADVPLRDGAPRVDSVANKWWGDHLADLQKAAMDWSAKFPATQPAPKPPGN